MRISDWSSDVCSSDLFVREEERGVLIVPATRDKFAGRANIDNRGTSELGPVRMQLAVDFNGVIGSNDALTVQGTVTPLQPRELQVGFVRYALQVGTAGTELATYASYGRTPSGGYWRAFDAKGESRSEEHTSDIQSLM